MSKIFVVMGKSATGKDTIYKKLIENKQLKLGTIITYTTRPIRQGETNGIEYFFVEEEKMLEMENQGKIIEHRSYDTIYGVWHYFTALDGQIDLEKSDYLIIGTLEAYEQIRKYYGEDKVVPIYIEVDDGIRLGRALSREEKQKEPKYSEMCRRFLADEEDFSDKNLVNLGIEKKYLNNDITVCLDEIIAFIIEKTSR